MCAEHFTESLGRPVGHCSAALVFGTPRARLAGAARSPSCCAARPRRGAPRGRVLPIHHAVRTFDVVVLGNRPDPRGRGARGLGDGMQSALRPLARGSATLCTYVGHEQTGSALKVVGAEMRRQMNVSRHAPKRMGGKRWLGRARLGMVS